MSSHYRIHFVFTLPWFPLSTCVFVLWQMSLQGIFSLYIYTFLFLVCVFFFSKDFKCKQNLSDTLKEREKLHGNTS